MNKQIVVAIDGYSSCGKSTMARRLAQAVDYIYVDTGAMYRSVALYALRGGWVKDGEVDAEALREHIGELEIEFRYNEQTSLPEIYLQGECVEQEIRTMQVASYASQVAALDYVREALTEQQRRMGERKGIVMDGRDIGTAVFPHAELKIFVTAQPQIRAQRRLAELRAKGDTALTVEDVLSQIEERDYKDTHRAISPLVQAQEAVVLDNSYLSIDEQHARLLALFTEAVERAGVED